MKDNLYTGSDVRKRLASGIKKVATAVGSTMGTSGGNSIIESVNSPGHLVTNDGFSIANSVWLEDPIENIGKNILLESINRANKASGDGSSTTCVLTAAIVEEGMKHIEDESPMAIKRSLEACIPVIESSIESQKKEVTVDNIGAVAAISAEDEEIGATIQEIYQQIGKEGIIHWDISRTAEDSYTVGSGLTIEGGVIASPYMCDRDKATGQLLSHAKLKSPLVLITKEKLTTAAVFEKLFMSLNAKGQKEIVIFADDYDVQVIAQLVATQQVQGFRAVVVKMPVIWNDQWTEDLALASGATVIDPSGGLALKDINESHLGKFEHVLIDKDNTYIDGIKDLSEQIAKLNEENTDDSKIRAARLNTKTARYFVGAQSDSALSYRRLKVEDAISASWQALQGGIVPGGGVALLNASKVVDNVILKEALQAPIRQIVQNAGGSMPILKGNEGFNSKTGEVIDMFEAQITDPANVVLNAVKNAISVAAAVLTANTVVILPRPSKEEAELAGAVNI